MLTLPAFDSVSTPRDHLARKHAEIIELDPVALLERGASAVRNPWNGGPAQNKLSFFLCFALHLCPFRRIGRLREGCGGKWTTRSATPKSSRQRICADLVRIDAVRSRGVTAILTC